MVTLSNSFKEIHKLGPKKIMLVPLEVLMENGGSSFEAVQIFKMLEKDYSNLCIVVPLYLMILF